MSRTNSLRELHLAALCWTACMLLPGAGRADELALKKAWRFAGDGAEKARNAFDRNIDTNWSSQKPQKDGVGVTIDFGEVVAIHRLILEPGEGELLLLYPRSLRCSMGDRPDALEAFHEGDYSSYSSRKVLDVKLNVRKGRYLRLQIAGQGAAYPWSIAEMRVYGFTGKDNLDARDAVVVADKMPSAYAEDERGRRWRKGEFWNVPDDIGARLLSYYLGEIGGRPVPIIKPEEKGQYGGTLFVIEEPKPLEYPKGDILHREEEAAHVYRKGREVRFAGHSPVGVYNSITEFLGRQGVRWVYPSAYGDYIPRREGIDLSVLPIDYAPQIVMRQCGGSQCTAEGFQGGEYWKPHHWNKGHGHKGTSYRQYGHHSFASLVPGKLYKEHPDWFPMFTDPKWEDWLKAQGHKLGDRVYRKGAHGFTFCTSNREAREHIVKQTVARAKERPAQHALSVGQMDTDFWCECPRCRAQDEGEMVLDETTSPPKVGKGNRIADLTAYLARRLQEELPNRTFQVGVLSYCSSAYPPPAEGEPLPDNASVNVVICSIPGYRVWLSPEASTNRKAVEAIKGWATKTKHLSIYTWDLLMPGSRIPAATITGSSEWFKLWKKLGVDGKYTETSTHPESKWRQNPWCYYTYSRLCWNPDEPADRIFDDFFNGYFQEAAEPMLAYYRTLENHLRENNLDYGGSSYQLQAKPEVFTREILKKMLGHLRQAEAAAARDYVTKRRVAGIRDGFRIVLDALEAKEEALAKK